MNLPALTRSVTFSFPKNMRKKMAASADSTTTNVTTAPAPPGAFTGALPID